MNVLYHKLFHQQFFSKNISFWVLYEVYCPQDEAGNSDSGPQGESTEKIERDNFLHLAHSAGWRQPDRASSAAVVVEIAPMSRRAGERLSFAACDDSCGVSDPASERTGAEPARDFLSPQANGLPIAVAIGKPANAVGAKSTAGSVPQAFRSGLSFGRDEDRTCRVPPRSSAVC